MKRGERRVVVVNLAVESGEVRMVQRSSEGAVASPVSGLERLGSSGR
jgi:hypothetical protein